MINLSVCLIVKNEELVIERCLKCVSQFADEIIVVDTGSTDKTKKIVKKWTENVFDLVWCNDFSKARNFAISKAKGKYIMWLDADDFITDKNIKKINKLKKNLVSDTYMLKYQVAFDDNNKPTFEYFRERILRNCESCKFNGFLHEAIVPFGNVHYENIVVEHRKVSFARDKRRNLKIYNLHMKNGAILNSRETFYYARELLFNGYYKKAIKYFKKFLKMDNKFFPNIIDAHICICDCFLFLNKFESAKNILVDSIKIAPPNAQICCKLGQIEILKKNYKNAIFWYKTALKTQKNEKSGEFFENDYYNFIPNLQLSFCYYHVGDYKNFAKFHNKAKKIKPYDKAILNNEKFIM